MLDSSTVIIYPSGTRGAGATADITRFATTGRESPHLPVNFAKVCYATGQRRVRVYVKSRPALA